MTEEVQDAVEIPTVEFSEDEVGNVTASFPPMNGVGPFSVTLQNMHWGLVEDLDAFGDESTDNMALLGFFREYIVGGPRAVPIKHTMTVFNAIRGYIEKVSEDTKNE
jgi:hypothetical protein